MACGSRDSDKLFELLPSSATNVTFNNLLTETDSFNVLTFEYIYNGAGVGVGDINNDGLTDIFFAGNMVSSKLYLNQGNFKFRDITVAAKVQTNLWCTGVAMVDINQDGLLDIHVSTIQPNIDKPSVPNLFFLNKGAGKDGVPLFEEVAAKMGIADSSYSTQAAFLDYDLDGDLDLYLLNNALEKFNRNQAVGQRDDGSAKSVDKFYRNEGMVNGLPIFKNVSKEAGIQLEGWGLGIVVNDINNDGYPDVYVANDFISNDNLLINNKHNSFTNEITSMLKHQEQNGMGVDIADINNDGLNDIVALDMMPDDNLRQKTMFSTIGYDRFMLFRNKGYQDQYIRNVLQINNGNNTFSDIGYLAGIYATDWSWSSLLADFDNDGYRDLFVGNGYRKDITDQDFIAYSKELAMFSTDRNRMNTIRQEVEKLLGVKKPNFLFKNNGDLTFSDKAALWGLDQPSYSNGAAYADFDNDGDLDLVTNNINDEAFIYRNKLNDQKDKAAKYLRIKLVGDNGDLQALGTKVWVFQKDKTYYAEHQTQRGYKSTVEDFEHVGLGQASEPVDSLKVLWPSGKSQVLKNIAVNQVIKLHEKDAVVKNQPTEISEIPDLMELHRELNINFKHHEKDFVDFQEGQLLLPQKHSQGGPGIATGDINNDGLEDFVVGGSRQRSAYIFFQQKNGTFKKDSLLVKEEEDMGLLLFDADGDSDLDLYCVSGSSEFKNELAHYRDRLYKNDGAGNFTLEISALPEIKSSGSCVVANDFDQDGDLDLFVGGRVVSMRYPETPESYLLVNNGSGKFENQTTRLSSELDKVGMVTSALWTDINNDGWTDLAVVGEWMPITFFVNDKGKSFTSIKLPDTSGWWNSINGGDFDNDGDIDYVAGNLGLNSVYRASVSEPVCVYAKDFDDNGSVDAILCRYIQGKEYPVHPRETLTGQISKLRGVAERYSIYGGMGIKDLIPETMLKDALVLKSTLFASVYLENNGSNTFSVKQLPVEAQYSPMYGSVVDDVNNDGNLDILSVGNSYASETLSGFYDAGIGNCLQGDGTGNFKPVHVTRSGFFVDGDAKALSSLMLGSGQQLFLATQNRDSLKVFSYHNSSEIPEENIVRANSLTASAIVELKNGKKRKHEFYYGSGYLSSSSRTIIKDNTISNIIVKDN
ncbi:VCBS repeat-containing protein [Chryseolinea sp. H1M3-3]|uniref:VCBS repeat-containing protein n=1 Tax=Chryseolinea sp. H1M3-3 TaxID=3034144 RepID=UPI0023EC61E7|nr:VCBS repeat-containing protein [Chryseolinea sp. H1M3-3]